MSRFVSSVLLAILAVGCGGSAIPRAQVADTQSSISAATAVGAEQHPQAALHLKMARDQLQQAQELIDDGKNEQAQLVLERANSDADLALMITREAHASAQANEAQSEVQNLRPQTP